MRKDEDFTLLTLFLWWLIFLRFFMISPCTYIFAKSSTRRNHPRPPPPPDQPPLLPVVHRRLPPTPMASQRHSLVRDSTSPTSSTASASFRRGSSSLLHMSYSSEELLFQAASDLQSIDGTTQHIAQHFA